MKSPTSSALTSPSTKASVGPSLRAIPWSAGLLAHDYRRADTAVEAAASLQRRLGQAEREGWKVFQETLWGPAPGSGAALHRHPAVDNQPAGARILLGHPSEVEWLDGYGIQWATPEFRACWLTGLRPPDPRAPRVEQAAAWWRQVKRILATGGFAPTDILRTWFYNDRILEWYDEFNEVRSAFFAAEGIFEKRVPASTGVGAANAAGTALQGDVLAIQPLNAGVRIEAVASPLQCPALDYRSSFSRAVEMKLSGGRILLISGTASIAPGGESLHPDDPAQQARLTLDVVEAILHSRGMEWADVYRGTAFYTDPEAIRFMDTEIRQRGGDPARLLPACCDICRPDLLFELEVDAWK